ncbi:MAG TPA: hypothetical protein VFA98_09400, partial [Thermoanaerobaculia bacterium]|nr:hypothetical protein [Thermoanaerobaculia bacterium]
MKAGRFATFILLTATTASAAHVVDCADAAALQRALDDARPGDVIRVVGRVGEKTTFSYSKSGSAGNPVVVTAKPGTRAVISGTLIPKNGKRADHMDVVRLAFDGGGANTDSCLQMVGESFRAINNVFTDCKPKNAILANDLPGQLIYGNVILDSNHGIYIQNTYEKNGYKPVHRNVITRLTGCASNCYSLHAYSQSGSNSGIDVAENYFHSAPVALVGGTNPTTKHEKFRSNVLYDGGGAQMGYKDGCAQIDDGSGNTFIRSQWQLDPLCSDADPNVIGPNTFYPDPAKGTYY